MSGKFYIPHTDARFGGGHAVLCVCAEDRTRGRYESDEHFLMCLGISFRKACLHFEQIHGQRASNDFRNPLPESTGAAIVYPDAARGDSRGGKEIRESTLPCVAPSVDNARIGASLSLEVAP